MQREIKRFMKASCLGEWLKPRKILTAGTGYPKLLNYINHGNTVFAVYC